MSTSVNTDRQRYDFSQIMHFRGPSLSDVTGISVIQMAKQAIGLALAQDAHGASTFRNKARAGVILKAPHYLKPGTRDTMLESFEQTSGCHTPSREPAGRLKSGASPPNTKPGVDERSS